MTPEEQQARTELHAWQQQMQRAPSLLNKFARRVQIRLNALLPERVHQAITAAIRQMVRGVLFGSQHTTSRPLTSVSFAAREAGTTRPRPGAYGRPCPVATGGIADFTGLFPACVNVLPRWHHRRCPKGTRVELGF